MARLKGPGALKQVALLAVWSPDDLTRDEKGNLTGCMVDMQVDQTDLWRSGTIMDGGDSNPHLASHVSYENGDAVMSHTMWYSKEQMNAILSVGQTCNQDHGRRVCGFRGDLRLIPDELKNGEFKVPVVIVPGDLTWKSEAERAKLDAYYAKHPLNAPDHPIRPDTLYRQECVTGECLTRNKAGREQRKSAMHSINMDDGRGNRMVITNNQAVDTRNFRSVTIVNGEIVEMVPGDDGMEL